MEMLQRPETGEMALGWEPCQDGRGPGENLALDRLHRLLQRTLANDPHFDLGNLDYIALDDLVFASHIGYYEEEQTHGQDFILSLKLYYQRSWASWTDELEDALNYAQIYEYLEDFFDKAHHRLMEKAGEDLVKGLFAGFPPLVAIDLKLGKPHPPIVGRFERMSIGIRRFRKKEVYLALGSNVGDRKAHLEAALEALAALPNSEILATSHFYPSKAWGKEDQADFLNAVTLLETEYELPELLRAVKGIEKALGRQDRGHWGPREIDIDLVASPREVLALPNLQVPHPYSSVRSFVYEPLLELLLQRAPYWQGMPSELGTPVCQETPSKAQGCSCQLGAQVSLDAPLRSDALSSSEAQKGDQTKGEACS